MIRAAAPFALAAVLVITGCGSQDSSSSKSSGSSAECPPEGGADKRKSEFTKAPPMCIKASKKYTATMTTDVGEVELALDAKKAPRTVNNFVVLARYKYYDGLTFHRVIQDFMIQGGDPSGDGSGGPGYEFKDELPKEGEYKVGSVAMANAGPDTNGSQFFIITGDAGVQLPPSYSLFGEVTKGMGTVEKIEADGNAQDGPPKKVHTIKSVTITEE